MKKLLIAMTAAGAFALGASAVAPESSDSGFISGTTFSALTPGDPLDVDADDTGSSAVGADLFWSAEQGADLSTCIISNAAAATATGTTRPKAWENDTDTTQYLSIDIDKRLSRSVNPLAAPRAIGDGLYFDSLVQFTATDTLPTVSEGDKLVVWLYGGEEDSEDVLGLGADKVSTNLVVTAGFVDGKATSPTNYVVTLPTVTVEPNSWHRLTIKAVANITEDGLTESASQIGGFVVYIDGVAATSSASKGDFTDVGDLTAAATSLGDKLFPSLVEAGAAAANLTCVAFEGTGAVDDLTFTTTDPFPEAAPFEYTVTVEDNDGVGATATYAIDGGSAQTLISGTPINVPVTATTVSFVVTIADGYKLVGGVKDSSSYDSVNETWNWTLSVAVSSLAKDGTDELTLSVVEDDGSATTYTLTLTPGTGTTLTATVGGSGVNTGAEIEENATVTITAALSDAEAYEDLVVTVGGVDVTSQLVNGSYSFTMTAATTVETSATAKQQPTEDYKVEIAGADVVVTFSPEEIAAFAAYNLDTPAKVNAFLASDFGSTGAKVWEVMFLGLDPTDADALDDFAVASITVANGKVTVTMADGITLQTNRGVDITLNVYGSDDLVNWGSTPLATATNTTTIPDITPALGETKKFYKVEVSFAATPAQD